MKTVKKIKLRSLLPVNVVDLPKSQRLQRLSSKLYIYTWLVYWFLFALYMLDGFTVQLVWFIVYLLLITM